MSDVSELLAKQAITEVLYRYCRAMDRMDRDLASQVWVPGGTADYGEDLFQGTAEGFLEWVWKAHAGLAGHSHQITNILIVTHGQTAVSEAYVTVASRSRPSNGRVVERISRGRYLDTWLCQSGRWAIAHRQHVIDLRSVHELREQDAGSGTTGARNHTDPSYGFWSTGRQRAPDPAAPTWIGSRTRRYLTSASRRAEQAASWPPVHPAGREPVTPFGS